MSVFQDINISESTDSEIETIVHDHFESYERQNNRLGWLNIIEACRNDITVRWLPQDSDLRNQRVLAVFNRIENTYHGVILHYAKDDELHYEDPACEVCFNFSTFEELSNWLLSYGGEK